MMNDRLVLMQTNKALNNDNSMTAHHDQQKMISNESIYHTDQRYTVISINKIWTSLFLNLKGFSFN